ncbi:protein KAKU4-like [Bidens hawaiensis]|uniref:protein KAKU4-like n=1 Tax=Bidens hawaiensis TaxID=980011 RepID=UPI004049BB44
MDSGLPAAADTAGARSGGKILKRKTTSHRTTPYDRPEPSNWRNGLLFPVKFVAGGATKLISSIWNPKTWGSNGLSSETDSDSEVGIEDECVPDANLPDGDAELTKNKGSSSGKSEIFYLIEQLIMLEHFSREERDKLIEIINSRVVDCTMKEGINAAPKNPDIIDKTITEARKIISENMVGTSSKSNLDNGVHGNMDNHSNASWKIQNEMQRLHSKVIELMKPDEHISLEALKAKNETANLVLNDTNTQDDASTETFSLPTIEEQHPIAEETGDVKNDKTSDDVTLVEANPELITERAEVTDVINLSQGSSNTSDPASTKAGNSPSVKRPVTRSRKYNTRRGRARGK